MSCRAQVCPGSLVAVPLGPQSVLGVVLERARHDDARGPACWLWAGWSICRGSPATCCVSPSACTPISLPRTAACLGAGSAAAGRREAREAARADARPGKRLCAAARRRWPSCATPRVVRTRASLARWRRRGWVRPVYRLHVTQAEKPSRLLVCGDSPPTAGWGASTGRSRAARAVAARSTSAPCVRRAACRPPA